jgi:hypothetical protein
MDMSWLWARSASGAEIIRGPQWLAAGVGHRRSSVANDDGRLQLNAARRGGRDHRPAYGRGCCGAQDNSP